MDWTIFRATGPAGLTEARGVGVRRGGLGDPSVHAKGDGAEPAKATEKERPPGEEEDQEGAQQDRSVVGGWQGQALCRKRDSAHEREEAASHP